MAHARHACVARLHELFAAQRLREAQDNDVAFWRTYCAEYYEPHAAIALCCCAYVGQDRAPVAATAPPPRELLGARRHPNRACSLCAAAPYVGFIASGATLPHTYAFRFEDGLLEERVTLQAPRVDPVSGPQGAAEGAQPSRAAAAATSGPSGCAVLTATCALEYVYDTFRVVHRGALRATFSAALKVEALELCLRGHELLLPCNVLARPIGALAALAREVEAREAGESSADVAASLASYAAMLSATVAPEVVTPLGFTQRHLRCLQLADAACAPGPGMDLEAATRAGPQQQLLASSSSLPLSMPYNDVTAAGGLRPPWPMSTEWQAAHAALSAALGDGLYAAAGDEAAGAAAAQHGAGRGSSEADCAEVPASRRRRGMPDPQQQPPRQRRRHDDAAHDAPQLLQPPVALPPAPPSLAAWAMAATSINALPDDNGGGRGDDDTDDDAFLFGFAGGGGLSPPYFPSIDALPRMPTALFEQMLRDAALP